jgi:hypothetical protein
MLLSEREALAAHLNSWPSLVLAVTLKYNVGPISIDKIRRDLRDLHAIVDRKNYGRHFNTSLTRSSYWAVGEMLDIAPHVHCGWRFPSMNDAKTLIKLLNDDGLWEKRYARGGTHDVQLYDRTGYRFGNGFAGYACKFLFTTDHVILSEK